MKNRKQHGCYAWHNYMYPFGVYMFKIMLWHLGVTRLTVTESQGVDPEIYTRKGSDHEIYSNIWGFFHDALFCHQFSQNLPTKGGTYYAGKPIWIHFCRKQHRKHPVSAENMLYDNKHRIIGFHGFKPRKRVSFHMLFIIYFISKGEKK